MLLPHTPGELNHVPQERSPWPNHTASMLELANDGQKLQDFILSQRRISLRKHSNFDGGRLRVMNCVHISIPRKVSLMLGPSVFLETTGTPKNAHRASTLCIAENQGLQRPGSHPGNGDRSPYLIFPVSITSHLLLRVIQLHS